MVTGDSIVALSSGAPPAAIAIIRTSGPSVFDALRALGGRIPAARQASLMALRDPATGDHIDDALVLAFPGPNSATGEDIVEYQCHGGRAVVDRLIGTLVAQPGFRPAEPGEFTRRGLVNGRMDLTEAEGLADLLEAETEGQRKAALLLAQGGLRRQVEKWRERIVSLSAQAEAAIDYVDDDDETNVDANRLAGQAFAIADEIQTMLDAPRAEPLKEGVRVVLAGPPNAGKSSLLNALIDSDRAIVTDIAGTTRDSIEVPVTMIGIPIVLIDTAGLRESDDVVEQMGVARAEHALRVADILLWLGTDETAPSHPRIIPILAKCDLVNSGSFSSTAIPVSVVTGEGINKLRSRIVELASTLLPGESQIAVNRRQGEALDFAMNSLRISGAEDIVIIAHGLRAAQQALDRLSGRVGVEDMLDAMFSRFCLGK